MANFTPEQERAIFTDDKNLIVVAGAGSGKTRVLVERYLHLLDANPDWPLNALVAITFTREAALEMRNRVRQELETRLQSAATQGNVAEQERWSSLLEQMDSARIDTIHGLCATILRANAAEAGIDPRFEVLEPIEAQLLLTDVIEQALQALAVADEDDIAALFTEYDTREIREVLSDPALLSAELAAIPDDPQALFQQWQQDWRNQALAIRQAVLHDATLRAALNWQPPHGWPASDKLLDVFRDVDHYWDSFAEGEVHEALAAAENIQRAINLRGGSQKSWGSKETVAEAKDVLRSVREAVTHFLAQVGEPPGELDRHAAHMLLRWWRLLGRVREGYQQAKAQQGFLDFDDLEKRTAHLLTHNEAVRARYQNAEFKRLLVDEFQDTNAAQWSIVRALTSMAAAALFVVGDPKQSIYAFRGADVSVFDEVRGLIEAQPSGEALPLSRSFRSHPGLIKAFNKLFAQILTRDENSPVAKYEIAFDHPMDAHREPLADDAAQHYSAIELLLLRNEHERLDEKLSAADVRVWEAYEIARHLKQLYEQRAPIDDGRGHTRPFDYSDAAVLFQSTTHMTRYEEVFKALGLPFVTVAGRGYYNRQEVWDVLNLLKALHNPADNLALAAALRSPMFGFSDEMLFALRRLRDDEGHRLLLWDALAAESVPPLDEAQLAQMRFAQGTLAELRGFAGRVTISELLRQALAKTGYLAILQGLPSGARLRRNVEKLVDIAEASGKITLGAFSHYLEDLTVREVREGEATLDTSGAVRLMTVHASKGLEFPVVVLADTSWEKRGGGGAPLIVDPQRQQLACKVYDPAERKLMPSTPYRYADYLQGLREAAERKRLLYVAATRARDCLIISGGLTYTKSQGWKSQGWLGSLLAPLEVGDVEQLSDGTQYAYVEHGRVRVWLPGYPLERLQGLRGGDAIPAWQPPAIQRAVPVPPRMQPLRIQQEDMLDHISATQLAQIGGFRHSQTTQERRYYENNVRRGIFDDAPAQIQEAIRIREPRIRRRVIGEVVHEALRYWRFPNNTRELDQLLRAYAWQQHISDEQQVKEVVQRARRLLERFQKSALYEQISAAKEAGLPFYAELPFLYRTEKRILHGVIDALYQRPDGQWVVLDYKTSVVRDFEHNPNALNEHARRYHLQVGAYASAVQQVLTGRVPRVTIHYIQHNQTLVIPTETWQNEIRQLEAVLGELVQNHAQTNHR